MEEQNKEQNTEIKYLRRDIDNLSKRMDEGFDKVYKKIDGCLVTKEEFEPIKSLYKKLTDFSLGFVIMIGSVVLGIFYFIREQIKK